MNKWKMLGALTQIVTLTVLSLNLLAIPLHAQEPWVYQPGKDIKFPLADSLISPYLCATDRLNNLWVISSSAVSATAKNALFKAAPNDTEFTLVVDFSSDLNIESTRGITTIGDTIYIVSRIPGTPWPSTSILYEYLDGNPDNRNDFSGPGYGTWVLGLSATKDKFIYSGLSYMTSIRVYDFTDTTETRGLWVSFPVEQHPIEPGGHDGSGLSPIRDVAVIPGADYNDATTPFFTSRSSDSTGAHGGIAVWTGGTQTEPVGYSGQRVTDVLSDLSWLYWAPYGITTDRSGNLYACGTDTTRRWVKAFQIMGSFAMELEELPGKNSASAPDPDGAPLLAPSDIALSPDEQIAYVIDIDAKKAFVFTRGAEGIESQGLDSPKSYKLAPNFPNPFNARTIITYEIPKREWVELKVFDVSGKQVAVLVNSYQNADVYRVNFDAKDLPSGIYLYKLVCGEYVETRKMCLIK
ncbi:MAG: T9SS type A sorting domain-containing protein [candidate division WOR-3 bacterium]|nr:T9SS type A sorting domain-containing protein [candidate division WOR-3 bacterium]